jgi:hypothetical protein
MRTSSLSEYRYGSTDIAPVRLRNSSCQIYQLTVFSFLSRVVC